MNKLKVGATYTYQPTEGQQGTVAIATVVSEGHLDEWNEFDSCFIVRFNNGYHGQYFGNGKPAYDRALPDLDLGSCNCESNRSAMNEESIDRLHELLGGLQFEGDEAHDEPLPEADSIAADHNINQLQNLIDDLDNGKFTSAKKGEKIEILGHMIRYLAGAIQDQNMTNVNLLQQIANLKAR